MKKQHWIDFVEYLSLIGLGAGSVLSVVTKQLLYTSAPISFALLVGFANRKRVEQIHNQKLIDSLSSLERKLSKNIKVIERQVRQLPTPEMIGDVRQSILRHTQTEITTLEESIENARREVEEHLTQLDQHNLTATRQEIGQIKSQYEELQAALDGLSSSVRKAATTERADELDQAVTRLTAETSKLQISMQSLSEHSKHTLSNVQDQVNQLSRQLKSLPPQVDASSIKREVGELVKVVADLVPRRDFNTVMSELRTLQQQQERQIHADSSLRNDIRSVYQRLQAIPDVPHLRSQLEESFTQEIRAINRRLRTFHTTPELRSKIEEVLRDELGEVQDQLTQRLSTTPYDLVFDLASDGPPDGSETSTSNGAEASAEAGQAIATGSRRVLEEALDNTQTKLTLIWPWSRHVELDGPLVRQIERFLQRERHLEIGWCHINNRQADRFLGIINRRWSINPLKQSDVQSTLQRLLSLKRRYPDYFRFKILGTLENFLISDSDFAVLGIQERLKTNTVLKHVDLKLRTTDADVIQHLIQRFEATNPPAHDIEAYWNRAITRYDLGDKAGAIADLDAILKVHPDDAAVYNLRGIIRYERKDIEGAIADLSASIALDPEQCSAYCNRGYLYSEQGDQYGAIADFSLAIQMRLDSAIAFFYRGAASQKLADHEGAISDYTEALKHAPNEPIVLYQRGMAYQVLEDINRAIADFEQAAQSFAEQGRQGNAEKAMHRLEAIRQTIRQTVQAHPHTVLVEPSEAEPSDAEPSEVGRSEVRRSEVEPLEVEPSDTEPSGFELSELSPSDAEALNAESSSDPSHTRAADEVYEDAVYLSEIPDFRDNLFSPSESGPALEDVLEEMSEKPSEELVAPDPEGTADISTTWDASPIATSEAETLLENPTPSWDEATPLQDQESVANNAASDSNNAASNSTASEEEVWVSPSFLKNQGSAFDTLSLESEDESEAERSYESDSGHSYNDSLNDCLAEADTEEPDVSLESFEETPEDWQDARPPASLGWDVFDTVPPESQAQNESDRLELEAGTSDFEHSNVEHSNVETSDFENFSLEELEEEPLGGEAWNVEESDIEDLRLEDSGLENLVLDDSDVEDPELENSKLEDSDLESLNTDDWGDEDSEFAESELSNIDFDGFDVALDESLLEQDDDALEEEAVKEGAVEEGPADDEIFAGFNYDSETYVVSVHRRSGVSSGPEPDVTPSSLDNLFGESELEQGADAVIALGAAESESLNDDPDDHQNLQENQNEDREEAIAPQASPQDALSSHERDQPELDEGITTLTDFFSVVYDDEIEDRQFSSAGAEHAASRNGKPESLDDLFYGIPQKESSDQASSSLNGSAPNSDQIYWSSADAENDAPLPETPKDESLSDFCQRFSI